MLDQWGIGATSDLGEIVYNLIASGDLEKSPFDSRSDFDHVYDFEAALRRDFVLVLDDVALIVPITGEEETTDGSRGVSKFLLALTLFSGWVIGLGAMALFSADRPPTSASSHLPLR